MVRFLRWPAEAALAYLTLGILKLLPPERASAFGGWLARNVGPWLGASRRVTANLRLAFPGIGDSEIRRVTRGSWDNLGRTFAEFPHLTEIVRAESDRVTLVGAENLQPLKAQDRPGILVGGHLANWEIIPVLLAHRLGLKMDAVVREPNNALVKGLLQRLRGVSGGRLVPKGAAGARRLLETLGSGGMVAVLVDQKMSDGVAVPFFGIEAMTPAAPAQLALRFRCPVVPVRVERLGAARFRLTCHPPLPLPDSGNRRADQLALTREINRVLEGWIRERPEEWFWLHRRWPDEAYEAGAGSDLASAPGVSRPKA